MPSVSRGIRDLGVVGRLRRHHSVHVALAEFMGIAGGSNRFVVGDHRGDVSAGTGDDAYYGADYRGADEQEGFPEYLEKHAQDHVTPPFCRLTVPKAVNQKNSGGPNLRDARDQRSGPC